MEPSWGERSLDWLGRLFGALFLWLLGAFLCGLVITLLLDPLPDTHPLSAFALKIFGATVLGGIGAGSLVWGVLVAFPGLRGFWASRVPAAVRSLCPGCGRSDGSCRCPPTEGAWKAQGVLDLTDIFLQGIFLGVGALGLFILVEGVWLSGEAPWVRVGYTLLGLLLLLVGGAIFWGGGLVQWERWTKNRRRYTFESARYPEGSPRVWVYTHASARVARGRLVEAQGQVEESFAWPDGQTLAARSLPPEEQALFQFLGIALANNRLTIRKMRRRSWTLGSAVLPSGSGGKGYRASPLDPPTEDSEPVLFLGLAVEHEGDGSDCCSFAAHEPEDMAPLVHELAAKSTVTACLEAVRSDPALASRLRLVVDTFPEEIHPGEADAWVNQLAAALACGQRDALG